MSLDKIKSDNRFHNHDYPKCFPTLKSERAHARFLSHVYYHRVGSIFFKLGREKN